MVRFNFTEDWLILNKRKINFYNIHELDERQSYDEEKIINSLSARFRQHYLNPEIILENFRELGKTNLAEEISYLIPKVEKVKMGDFGEIVTAEYLADVHDYEIFYKMREKPNPDMPLHGEDVVLFKVEDNEIVSMAIAESKAHKNYSKSAFTEACKKAPDDFRIRRYISFLKNKYSNKNTEMDKIIFKSLTINSQEIRDGKLPKIFWIFFINELDLHLLEKHVTDEKKLPKNSNFVSIHINNLDNFVEKVFRMCKNFSK